MDFLAVIHWDPQLRGTFIVLTAVLILPGSVYLLLATNVGAKVGLMLAIAGLSGWLVLLNLLWLGYGIGYKGVIPGWKVEEVISGDLVEHSTTAAVVGQPGKATTTQFPNGWRQLLPGDPLLATAEPAADNALIPPAAERWPGERRSRPRSGPPRTTSTSTGTDQGRPQLPVQLLRVQGLLAQPGTTRCSSSTSSTTW